jgi:O-antigen ligase
VTPPLPAAPGIALAAARAGFLLFIAALPWSIAAQSSTVAICTALTVAALALRRTPGWPRTPVELPAIAWFLALLLSALFALDRAASLPQLKKALFPALVPLVALYAGEPGLGRRGLAVLLASAGAAALLGLAGFIADGASFAARARGAAGHYMTFGGQLMLIASLGTGLVLAARDRRWRLAAAGLAVVACAALAATFTRSSWIGLAVSLAVMLALARPRLLPWLAAAAIALVALSPPTYRERALSAFDLRHPANRERTYMWEAGMRMFRERPLTGVGLQSVRSIYDRYRSPEAVENATHLHSVPVQIAATTGAIGLAAFLALYASLFAAAASGLRAALRAGAGLGAGLRLGVCGGLAGFLAAGLFEWNFGDEELLYLLYALVGLAWAARGWPAAEPPHPVVPR